MISAPPRFRGRLGALLGATMLIGTLMVPATAAAAPPPLDALAATLAPGDAEGGSGAITMTAITDEVCFDLDVTLPDIGTDPVTSVDITTQDRTLVLNLATGTDGAGHAEACVMTTTEIVDDLLESPGLYQVHVTTAAYADPMTAVWGPLEWGYPQTHLDVFTYMCPPEIQDVEDITEDTIDSCESLVLPADDITGDVPGGSTLVGYAGTATFDYHVVDGVRIDETIAEAAPPVLGCSGGVCDGYDLPYRWSQLHAADTINVEATTLPTDTRVGAVAVFDGDGPDELPFTIESDDSVTIDATGVTTADVLFFLFGPPLPDATAPSVTTPIARFDLGGVFGGGTAPVDVTWDGFDVGSAGLDHFVLQVSVDGGSYTTIDDDIVAFRKTTTVSKGHTYRFRVRGVDAADNQSAWKYSATSKLVVIQDGNDRVDYTGAWKRKVDTDAAGDTVRKTSVKGRLASLSFFGRAVAWVAPTGAAYGKAKVYIDGEFVETIDLSGADGDRVQVFKKNWSQNGGHTITVKVLGTAGHPRVEIDAFLYLK